MPAFTRASVPGPICTPHARRTFPTAPYCTADGARGFLPPRRTLCAGGARPLCALPCREESVSFTDGHLGHFSQNLARECGDFILRRSDGIYAYQLAVAVDDARMGVTQVVRGQDLLSSTPRQIFLQRLLGLPTPEYYHLPLLVNAEGVRLSKREKSLDMGALRARFTPAELTGWLAFLAGQQPAPEPVPLRSLAACFSWEKVPRRDITVPARLLNEARAE